MPQSGVTSDDSWYLTSFVILSFYYLPVCLTLLTVQTQINSFLNGEYRRFRVLLLRAERRGLYFVALAVLALSIHSDAADFSYQADRIYLSTQLTHTYVIIAREPMTGLLLHRGFCRYPDLPWNRRELGYAASPYKVDGLKRTWDCSSFT